jgi:hypothetical protein
MDEERGSWIRRLQRSDRALKRGNKLLTMLVDPQKGGFSYAR